MISTPKVVIIILLAAGIFSFCFSQQEDSIAVKDSSVFADSSSSSDSVVTTKVNKDSAAALDSLLLMQKKFEQFKYGDVISIANKLLLRKTPFIKKEILEIYKMKGISHYSLSEDDAAKKSFIEILRADSSYTLDSTKVSPKIISFFRQVKNDYIQQQKEIESRTVVRIDTIYVPKIEYDYEHEAKLKGAVARSLIIPGLGQLYRGEYVKGVILTVLSSASIISSLYYIIDSNKKEKAYLVETNSDLIESKYSEYNSSYKKRNISLISFGILWLYSQIDILFLADHETSGNNFIKSSSLHYDELKGLTLNFKYSF
jgi:TM2 domain-containing membrane protein YozV